MIDKVLLPDQSGALHKGELIEDFGLYLRLDDLASSAFGR